MTDKRTVQIVVVFLGLIALAGLAGTIWLTDHGTDAALVIGITGTALGALGGLLTNTSTVDPESERDIAYTAALADVASLADVSSTSVSTTTTVVGDPVDPELPPPPPPPSRADV